MLRNLIILTIILPIALSASATLSRTAKTEIEHDSLAVDSTAQHGLVKRVISYFGNANKSRPTNKLDFSFIGGPHYSSDSKLGLGIVASGIYTTTPEDTTLTPSNLSIKADATTAAHFMISVSGEHITPKDQYRLSYDVDFSYIDTKFWGIGFDQCKNNNNESDYKYLAANAKFVFTWNLGHHLYLGPMVTFNYVNAKDFEYPELWQGLPRTMSSFGIGATIRYDSRDNITAPTQGMVIRIDQTFNGRWIGNRFGYNVNDATIAYYKRIWRGGILATQLHSRITWGDTPWGMLSYIGGSHNMRGYFEGRYRDKSEIDLCAELRQHVWRRNSIAIWLGAASVFPDFSEIRIKKILPNAGIGYRWEFKKNVNVRVDLGFGRGQSGIVFNVNEAF